MKTSLLMMAAVFLLAVALVPVTRAGCGARRPPPPPANARGIPAGTYRGSCNGCDLREQTLHCSHCQNGRGGVSASSIQLSECTEGVIGNVDGVLTCQERNLPEHRTAAADLPAGGYLDSCGGCGLAEGVLRCTGCLNAKGNLQVASITVSLCGEDGAIVNDDGKLKCDSAHDEL